MPSVSLIGAPLVIKGLTVWLRLYDHFRPKNLEKNKYKFGKSSKRKKLQLDTEVNQKQLRFIGVGLSLLISHFVGWLFIYSGVWLSNIGFNMFKFTARHSIYIGFSIYFIFSLNISHFFKFSQIELNVLNIVALLELATLLLIIAMHNFSLSLILSVVYVPCVCFISARSGRYVFGSFYFSFLKLKTFNLKFLKIKLKIFKIYFVVFRLKRLASSLHMLLIHPFVFAHLIVLVYTFLTLGDEDIFIKTFSATQNSFVYLVMDEMIYGNWLIKAVFGFFIPNWILFWICLQS